MKSALNLDTILFSLAALYAALFAVSVMQSVAGISGLMLADGNPAGGDFINLYTAGKMVLAGHANQIYVPDAFMLAQKNFIPADIGVRLWAYPPQSLFLALPFAFLPFYLSLAAWSLLGLFVLYFGARALNISPKYSIFLCFNPAALQCVFYGQTGNLAVGLLLLALSPLVQVPGAHQSTRAGLSAAALTIKPQFGITLPFLLLLQKRWSAFWIAVASTLTLCVASFLFAGPQIWLTYAQQTAPALTSLELSGSGAFMLMIPSFFMSLRIIGLEGHSALMWHGLIVIPIGILAIIFIWISKDYAKRIALGLLATALITPYLHVYDMSIILAAALVLCLHAGKTITSLQGFLLTLTAWLLPHPLYDLNASGWPVTPLVLVVIFVFTLKQKGPENQPFSSN